MKGYGLKSPQNPTDCIINLSLTSNDSQIFNVLGQLKVAGQRVAPETWFVS